MKKPIIITLALSAFLIAQADDLMQALQEEDLFSSVDDGEQAETVQQEAPPESVADPEEAEPEKEETQEKGAGDEVRSSRSALSITEARASRDQQPLIVRDREVAQFEDESQSEHKGDVRKIRISDANTDYLRFRTQTTSMRELTRVVDLPSIQLELEEVSASAAIGAIVYYGGLEAVYPVEGLPRQAVAINAEAHPLAIMQAILDEFDMQAKLEGTTWKIRYNNEPDPAILEEKEEEKILTPLEMEMVRLESLPKDQVNFPQTNIRQAILTLVMRAGMQVIFPSEEMPNATVTLRGEANPFSMLQLLAERYGLGMEYTGGLWNIYPVDIEEIVSRTYKLQHNDMMRLEVNAPTLQSSMGNRRSRSSSSGSGSGGGIPGGSGASGPSGGSGGGAQNVFSIPDEHPLVERLEAILALPTTGLKANQDALHYITESGGQLPPPSVAGRLWGRADKPQNEQARDGGQVQYFPANGALVVYATRQQHEYIEAIINAMDKPQRLINYTAFIFETTVNPERELGFSWSEGVSLEMDNWAGPTINDGFDIGGAVLNASGLRAQLNLLATHTDTVLTNKPFVTSRAMEPVKLASMENRPVRGVSYDASAAGGTVSSETDYIQIGTGLDAFGRVLNGKINGMEAIELHIVVTVSEQAGEVVIDDAAFPVVQERAYQFTAVVPNGHTVVIGGITKDRDSSSLSRVPILGDIPILGLPFRNKRTSRETVNLIAYITPTLLNDADGNIRMETTRPMPESGRPSFTEILR